MEQADGAAAVDEQGRVVWIARGERIVLGPEEKVFEEWCRLMAERDFDDRPC